MKRFFLVATAVAALILLLAPHAAFAQSLTIDLGGGEGGTPSGSATGRIIQLLLLLTVLSLAPAILITVTSFTRIIVVLSDQPIDVAAATRAARAAYDKAGGNLARMPSLDLPGEQFVRTFAKP